MPDVPSIQFDNRQAVQSLEQLKSKISQMKSVLRNLQSATQKMNQALDGVSRANKKLSHLAASLKAIDSASNGMVKTANAVADMASAFDLFKGAVSDTSAISNAIPVITQLGAAMQLLKGTKGSGSSITDFSKSLQSIPKAVQSLASVDTASLTKKINAITGVKIGPQESGSLQRLQQVASHFVVVAKNLKASINQINTVQSVDQGRLTSIKRAVASISSIDTSKIVQVNQSMSNSKGIHSFASAINRLGQGALNFNKSYARLAPALQLLAKSGKKLGGFAETGAFSSFQSVGRSIQALGKGLAGLSISNGFYTSVNATVYAVQQLVKGISAIASETPSAASSFEKLSQAVYKLCSGLNLATHLGRQVKQQQQEATQSLNLFTNGWNRLFSAIIGGSFILRVVGWIKSLVSQMYKLDFSMRQINTLARQSQSGLNAMKKTVYDVSSSYGIAASQVSRAMFTITSATIKGKGANQVLKASAKLAVAGASDIQQSAQLISSVIQAYGKSAYEAQHIADVLFKTQERGITTLKELGSDAPRVFASAASAGVSFEQVNAALATLTNRGLQTNIAVTSLNSLLLKLAQDTKKLDVIFRGLGFASTSAAMAQKGLGYVMQMISQQAGGTLSTLSKLSFSYRDIRAATILANDVGGVFAQNMKLITDGSNTATAAQKAFAQMQKSSLQRIMQIIQGLKNSLMDVLEIVLYVPNKIIGAIAAIRSVLNQSPLGRMLMSLVSVILKVSAASAGLSATIAGFKYIMPMFVASFSPLKNTWKSLLSILQKMRPALHKFIQQLKMASAKSFGDGLNVFTNFAVQQAKAANSARDLNRQIQKSIKARQQLNLITAKLKSYDVDINVNDNVYQVYQAISKAVKKSKSLGQSFINKRQKFGNVFSSYGDKYFDISSALKPSGNIEFAKYLKSLNKQANVVFGNKKLAGIANARMTFDSVISSLRGYGVEDFDPRKSVQQMQQVIKRAAFKANFNASMQDMFKQFGYGYQEKWANISSQLNIMSSDAYVKRIKDLYKQSNAASSSINKLQIALKATGTSLLSFGSFVGKVALSLASFAVKIAAPIAIMYAVNKVMQAFTDLKIQKSLASVNDQVYKLNQSVSSLSQIESTLQLNQIKKQLELLASYKDSTNDLGIKANIQAKMAKLTTRVQELNRANQALNDSTVKNTKAYRDWQKAHNDVVYAAQSQIGKITILNSEYEAQTSVLSRLQSAGLKNTSMYYQTMTAVQKLESKIRSLSVSYQKLLSDLESKHSDRGTSALDRALQTSQKYANLGRTLKQQIEKANIQSVFQNDVLRFLSQGKLQVVLNDRALRESFMTSLRRAPSASKQNLFKQLTNARKQIFSNLGSLSSGFNYGVLQVKDVAALTNLAAAMTGFDQKVRSAGDYLGNNLDNPAIFQRQNSIWQRSVKSLDAVDKQIKSQTVLGLANILNELQKAYKDLYSNLPRQMQKRMQATYGVYKSQISNFLKLASDNPLGVSGDQLKKVADAARFLQSTFSNYGINPTSVNVAMGDTSGITDTLKKIENLPQITKNMKVKLGFEDYNKQINTLDPKSKIDAIGKYIIKLNDESAQYIKNGQLSMVNAVAAELEKAKIALKGQWQKVYKQQQVQADKLKAQQQKIANAFAQVDISVSKFDSIGKSNSLFGLQSKFKALYAEFQKLKQYTDQGDWFIDTKDQVRAANLLKRMVDIKASQRDKISSMQAPKQASVNQAVSMGSTQAASLIYSTAADSAQARFQKDVLANLVLLPPALRDDIQQSRRNKDEIINLLDKKFAMVGGD